MTVLIVTESCFGNTLTVAQAIASGVASYVGRDHVTITRSCDAPRELPANINLLLVGAPTHDFSMPKEQTRQQATAQGATGSSAVGVREWIEHVAPRADVRVVTFDTSLKKKFMPGSASKAATKALKKRGFKNVERGQSFYVIGTAGGLVGGEERRAFSWAEQLVGGSQG